MKLPAYVLVYPAVVIIKPLEWTFFGFELSHALHTTMTNSRAILVSYMIK